MDDLTALDLVPEAVVVIAEDGTLLHRNRRADVLLGLDDAAVGEPVRSVVDLRDDSGSTCTDCLLPASWDVDRLAERVLKLRLADGRTRPVAVAARVLDDRRVVATFRHAGRRERVDAARSDLVATVSHELRSPLTSVKGFSRTMLAKWDRFSDEQKQNMLSMINEDADRLTRLLQELLDVSRIDAGRLQLRRDVISLEEIVERVVERAGHHTYARPIDVRITGPLPKLFADGDKLDQVLTNLVNNALVHGEGANVRVEVTAAPDVIDLAVSDEGPGIPPDQLRNVFGKFSRGRTNRRAGTGLGLYITRGLVVAHGGSIWCESVLGSGTTFHVSVPVLAVGGAAPA